MKPGSPSSGTSIASISVVDGEDVMTSMAATEILRQTY